MKSSKTKGWKKRVFFGIAFASSLALAFFALANDENERPSTCYERGKDGALRDAWKLPRKGANFRSYGDLGWTLGRTYVHSIVYETVLDAYEEVFAKDASLRFIYGETGFARGGRFRPHRTHKKGTSVDFMVPVRDASGNVVELPTSLTNKLGYGLEFDDSGRLDDLVIDFEAIALHLAALTRSAKAHQGGISRVIFDPKLLKRLETTRAWPEIRELPFMREPAWIRHDEHYHIDFAVSCRSLDEIE